MKRKVYLRADASATIGYGHFIRTLALADMLREAFDCTFFTTSPTPYQEEQLKGVCSYRILHEESKFEDFLGCLDGSEIVVLDNYFYTTAYQREVKARGCSLVCIDDMHDKHYVADIVINHGLDDPAVFDCEPYTRLCLGYGYALLRAPFLEPVPNHNRNDNLIVCFGGADPFGITERVVSQLLEMSLPYHLVVILGDRGHLSDENRRRVTVRQNLSAEQMAQLFEQSAAGILSASTVCIEALSRRLPFMVGYYVDNQREMYRIMTESGYALPLGFLRETTSKTLADTIHHLAHFVLPSFPTDISNRMVSTFNTI